jgi:hypothetical protein
MKDVNIAIDPSRKYILTDKPEEIKW